MYNVDRRSKEFIVGVHYFLGVAEVNKQDSFMCCPCAISKNLKEYSCSKNLHTRLFMSGFVPNYICWMKHGEKRIVMDDGEEDEELDHADIIAQYGAFDDDAMRANDEKDVAATKDVATNADALGDAICNAQRECESEKEKAKFKRTLEDHRKLLYPTTEDGQTKLGITLELLQWKANNGTSDKAFGRL